MSSSPTILDFLGRHGTAAPRHRPWPRFVLDAGAWRGMAEELARRDWTLLGEWADDGQVHAALWDGSAGAVAVASVPAPDGTFPGLSQARPGAIRLERAIHDLWGMVPQDLEDGRPWLDHGRWPMRFPLAAQPGAPEPAAPYPFLPATGDGLHRIPLGPVHAGLAGPGHFRFTCRGETVVRLETRLGYAHRGIEGLLRGATLDRAARLAGRISGDATVAYALAFARAVEAATGAEVPPRAHHLRGVMAEIERVANHLADIGAQCGEVAFPVLQQHCLALRETMLRAAEAAFGHRLMRDRIVPGGVVDDIARGGRDTLERVVAELRSRLPALMDLYDERQDLLDRTVGIGIVEARLVDRFGAGGHVGRASGRGFDTRRALPYPPYDTLSFDVPVLAEGDVNARLLVRVREIEQSLRLIVLMLAHLPDGAVKAPLPWLAEPAEGVALVESFRGDVLVWLRLAPGALEGPVIERCHPRDPSWFHWPLLEEAAAGGAVADFPLCNRSFNCSVPGVDL